MDKRPWNMPPSYVKLNSDLVLSSILKTVDVYNCLFNGLYISNPWRYHSNRLLYLGEFVFGKEIFS